jgi:hypothetical protein
MHVSESVISLANVGRLVGFLLCPTKFTPLILHLFFPPLRLFLPSKNAEGTPFVTIRSFASSGMAEYHGGVEDFSEYGRRLCRFKRCSV